MGRVVVIGEGSRVAGYALAGTTVCAADTPNAVLNAWTNRPADTTIVILTASAADTIAEELTAASTPLTVVMPP